MRSLDTSKTIAFFALINPVKYDKGFILYINKSEDIFQDHYLNRYISTFFLITVPLLMLSGVIIGKDYLNNQPLNAHSQSKEIYIENPNTLCSVSSIEDYPYLVTVIARRNKTLLSTGVLISPLWVLSLRVENPSNLMVRLGSDEIKNGGHVFRITKYLNLPETRFSLLKVYINNSIPQFDLNMNIQLGSHSLDDNYSKYIGWSPSGENIIMQPLKILNLCTLKIDFSPNPFICGFGDKLDCKMRPGGILVQNNTLIGILNTKFNGVYYFYNINTLSQSIFKIISNN